MLLADVAAASAAVATTSARGAKTVTLAELLRRASPQEARVVVSWLSGELTQRQIGVGWAALRGLPDPAGTPTLDVLDVERRLSDIGALSGAGSQAARRDALHRVFSAATAPEQDFLRRLLGGELRQGALAGVMTDAVARAADLPLADVRRAAMLRGDLPAVAELALGGGAVALADVRLELGRPVGPMLAQTATSTDDALARLGGGPAAFEWKLDGARVQVHRDGDDVGLFTRSLDDVTARLPELVEAVRASPGSTPGRRRRGARAAPGRPAAPVPGHRVQVRQSRSLQPSGRAPDARRCSTSCTATVRTCSTRRARSGRPSWRTSSRSGSGSRGW